MDHNLTMTAIKVKVAIRAKSKYSMMRYGFWSKKRR